MIASASRDKTIKINKLSTGEILTIPNNFEPNIKDYYRNTFFNSIAFSPDNRHLLFTLAGRNEIFFWDIKSKNLAKKITGHEDGI
jgi:WD40 repeat protein